MRPAWRPSRTRHACPGAQVWTGLAAAVFGLLVGILGMTLFSPAPQAAAFLTPQQQTLYALVQDLAQTSTPDQAWVIMTRLDAVVRTMHPQPRPRPESLLPTQHGRTGP